MNRRRLGEVARDKGGFLVMSGGVIWEGVEVSHTFKYLRELAGNLDWKGVAEHLWHPSALSIFAIGCAWSLGIHMWHRYSAKAHIPSVLAETRPPDVAEVGYTHLEATNIAEIAKVLKPGDSCEITEEVTRKRTITLHAGQR